MKTIPLQAEKRTVVGKKVKNLRKQHLIPGNIFGKDIKSSAVQLDLEKFITAYKKAGETGVLELNVNGETKPVIVQNVQLHPVTGAPLHIDFRQVSLKEKVKAHVPVEIMGEAPAVVQKLGLLLNILDKIEVESLPLDLPEKIEVDVSVLKQVGDVIKAKDVRLKTGVTLISPPDADLVKVGSLVTKEAEKLAAEEAAVKAAAQAAVAPTAVEADKTKTTTPEIAAKPEAAPAKK